MPRYSSRLHIHFKISKSLSSATCSPRVYVLGLRPSRRGRLQRWGKSLWHSGLCLGVQGWKISQAKRSLKTGWWFQPLWKILIKLEIFPIIGGENKQSLKTPPIVLYFFGFFSGGGGEAGILFLNQNPKTIPSLKLTAKAPENGPGPEGKRVTSIPTIHFQGRAVSFREGKDGKLFNNCIFLSSFWKILLMVQTSGVHQVRLVVYSEQGFIHGKWCSCFFASTVFQMF